MTQVTNCGLEAPKYEVDDNGDEIVLTIVAPLAKPKEAALILEEGILTFESSPYLLKFKFSHAVSDRFNYQAYNSATATYKIKLKKKGLLPEESSSDEQEDDIKEIFEYLEESNIEEEENNQAPQEEEDVKQYYGFANSFSRMFGKLFSEFAEVIHLPDPDNTPVSERTKLRLKEENEKWNDDHYLADTMETDHLVPLSQYKPPWITFPIKGELDDYQMEILNEIIRSVKQKELSAEMKKLSELQLIDVLFAYAYNKRTTEGDNTVESGWTINIISSTLSWFEVFKELKSVVISCFRRCLIYPLYRNWNLAEMIRKDVVDILRTGPVQLTDCLLETIQIFKESENRYILNTLYLNGLCSFSYHMTSERLMELSTELENIKVTKYEVNPELPLLEIAAHATLEEEKQEGAAVDAEKNCEKLIEKFLTLQFNDTYSGESSESQCFDGDSSSYSDYES